MIRKYLVVLLVLGAFVRMLGAIESPVIHEFRDARILSVFIVGGVSLICLFLLPGPSRLPSLPTWFVTTLALLIGWGAFMVWNAHSDHSVKTWFFDDYDYASRPFPSLPGSVASSSSMNGVWELMALTLALFAVSRAARSEAWIGLIKIFMFTASVVVVIALLHRMSGAETLWWMDSKEKMPGPFFGPFGSNAAAAAFLNLILPVSLGMVFRSLPGESDRDFDSNRLILSLLSSGLMIVGVLAAASKGGVIIMGIVIFMSISFEWRTLLSLTRGMRRSGRSPKKIETWVGAILAVVVLAVFVTLASQKFQERWNQFQADFGEDGEARTLSERVVVREKMIVMAGPDEGSWHGFGPNTFPHVFPYYNRDNNEVIQGKLFARGHCDPLQTIVEWGAVGFAGWAVLGGGAVLCGLWVIIRRKVDRGTGHLVIGMIVGLVGVGLHSSFDFPLSNLSIHTVAMLYCGLLASIWHISRKPTDSPYEDS